ncbi:MAG: flavodoxin domain-containing protein [Proteobacteria bacterium]|nr:flavodoxin domain-containing protein [Pseudomonadota bacterium]MBU1639840.1 flavodoxin domain-containing protein [Pseudomonadota bacterium]
MGAEEIKENIYWVGAIDWNIRDFHGYSTYKGTTYNSYLIKDEKICLFDTVKSDFKNEMLYHIRQLIDPEQIDYIVVNHVELDHSGYLPEMIALCKPEKVFCSPMGLKAIESHFHPVDWPLEVVKSGDSISLGAKTVQFLETKMLHWPDSMFSYIPEDKLLISSDAFGQHLASTERYADELPEGAALLDAEKYYANILMLFSPNVQKLLAKVAEMGLDIDMIAPDHGVIWRDPALVLAAYDRWSQHIADRKAVIIYDSMWHSTEKMAKNISAGLRSVGVHARVLSAKVNHRSDIIVEVASAKAVIVGSPTLNNGIMPTMADVLTYMKGLRPRKKIGAAFGSFGWSGESVNILTGFLEDMHCEVIEPGVKVKNVPDHAALQECFDLGVRVGMAVNASMEAEGTSAARVAED